MVTPSVPWATCSEQDKYHIDELAKQKADDSQDYVGMSLKPEGSPQNYMWIGVKSRMQKYGKSGAW